MYSIKSYPIKDVSYKVPNKTFNKVSMHYYYIVGAPPSPLKLSPPRLVASIATPNGDFRASPPPHLFAPPNPKSHKYDKYDKAPYIVSFYR